ncbi:hypothetical protein FACUT_12241 [Fusarium acutatum]|uniref:Aminoglycoside phosphotransferase domain-containing protein n=1 Tax=Fusarium acutatum TaxID=78861 RepID=A0A8H4JBP8_9HYPO|nr:hypothetical protein FACUT_12241 [Fusarium acutatum]
MEPFKLSLQDGTVLSGISNIPSSPSTLKHRPLVVGLHGGCYTSHYFDATPEYTVRGISEALSVPFVAIDRPDYRDTTPVGSIREGSSYPEQWGRRLYESILPALWKEYGLPNACTCIVLYCHSLGANGAIVASSLHATSSSPAYPLGGIVISGFGSLLKDTGGHVSQPDPPPSYLNIPVEVKDKTLLLPGTADEAVYAQSERLDHAIPFEELAALRKSWLGEWKEKWGVNVTVPVMITLAQRDHYWDATEEHLKDFREGFPKSERVDLSIVKAAPHNIELSYWGPGWARPSLSNSKIKAEDSINLIFYPSHCKARKAIMRQTPPPKVLDAFGAEGSLIHIPGGRGLCYRTSQGILLRPSDDDKESEYIATLCKSLLELHPTDYRVPMPIQAPESPARYVCDGWTAWEYLEGKTTPQGKFDILMRACRAFHADVMKLAIEKPLFLLTRQDRFTEADLVAWEEKKLEDVEEINSDVMATIQPILDQLLKLRQPFRQEIKNQLIHGNLTGNVLFDSENNNPQAIIDITLYWRPAEYAEAIMVADGLIWLNEDRKLVDMFGTDHTRIQLLSSNRMVGVPSSRGCNSCRKAKKRYKPDTQTTQLITPPAETPSNDTTRLTAEFISLMEIDDDRFGFEAYGPYFFADLPRRMGSNSALDTTTSAMIASFQAIRLRKTADKKTFSLYGKALRSLQGCLSDENQPVMLKLELVLMIMLCQIYAALCDPKVELGSWFWDVAVQDTIMTRPYHYEQNLYCFELGAIGDLPVFLRDPERYLYQLKCYYNILSQERAVMKKLYEEAMVATLPTDASPACRMKAIEYASGHAGLLVQAALIGPTLKPFGVLPDYTQDSHEICDDAILLAHRCQTFRPCGASYVPELLKLVWASLDDGYRHEELEKLMDEYAEDVQGASYLEEAKIMRKRLDSLGWSNEQRFLEGRNEGLETPPPCVIL